MIRVGSKSVRLTVAPEFGCRWMRLQVKIDGRWSDLIVPASLKKLRRDPFFDGAYLMAPWCNRIPRGRFRFRGKSHQLRPNFPDGSAIHGDAWGRRWRVTRRSGAGFEAILRSTTVRGFNFPWPVEIRHGARITKNGVAAWISVKNLGSAPCPAGAGFHPFFRRPSSLTIPPRKPARLAKRVFDEEYALTGRAVRLQSSDAVVSVHPGRNATRLFVWAPKRFRGKPAKFACVEPMTMRVGEFGKRSVRVLKPGETVRMDWRVTAEER